MREERRSGRVLRFIGHSGRVRFRALLGGERPVVLYHRYHHGDPSSREISAAR
jgi:hypothetical protein